MKIWVDDVRPAPEGYEWCKSTLSAQLAISAIEAGHKFHGMVETVELIDLDHDAGEYASEGGDYIKILDWIEATGRTYPIRIHSMNPVGVQNMRAIIQRNGWKEIF